MQSDFEIKESIYLIQGQHRLDLHNNFDFLKLEYSVETRTLTLYWRASRREGVPTNLPTFVRIEFRGVSQFRFEPRKAEVPFTEDNCLSGFGYWVDEDLADKFVLLGPGQTPEPEWLTAVHFMSGATVAVQAQSAHAEIEA
jgi:hypothetical protein